MFLYIYIQIKTSMTEAVSVRSNQSNKNDSYYNTTPPSAKSYPHWQDDRFYEDTERPSIKHATLPSTRSSRKNLDPPIDNSVRYPHDMVPVRRASLGEQYLNNSESSEYVLYYGKGSQRKNDSLNYIDSDKNDLYAKVVK